MSDDPRRVLREMRHEYALIVVEGYDPRSADRYAALTAALDAMERLARLREQVDHLPLIAHPFTPGPGPTIHPIDRGALLALLGKEPDHA